MPNTLHPPASVIASWPTPNYTSPQTRGPALLYVCIILSGVAVLTVSARLYSRVFLTKAPGFDDFLIMCSVGFAIGLSVLLAMGDQYATGHHIWDIPPTKFAEYRLNTWASEWCYVISAACVKISVLLFYRRLSVTFSTTFLIATWAGIVFNIAYIIAFCSALAFMCTPVNAYWMSFDAQWATTHKYHCGNESISLPISGAFSVIGDFYSALLPMLLIMNLHLPIRQKIGLYCLFALAFLVVAAGIVRTVLLNAVINRDYDFPWILWEMWIWSLIELYLAVLAASAPALKPFFRRFLVEPISSAVDSRGGNRYRKAKGSDQWGKFHPYFRSKGWSLSSTLKRGSATDPELERIGVAHGGVDKTREETFVRELDDQDLETRHYELRASRDGKIIPTQVWKKSPGNGSYISMKDIDVTALPKPDRNSAGSTHPSNWPAPPPASYNLQSFEHRLSDRTQSEPHRPQHQQQHRHVRNFSQPHTVIDSDGSQPTSPSQKHQRQSSKGSVKAGRLRAQSSLAHSQYDEEAGIHRRQDSNTSARHRPQNIFDYASQPHFNASTMYDEENGGRGSRLDSPSDTEDEFDLDEDGYGAEKPPWNSLRSPSQSSSRSTSEETLHLPRMGSRDLSANTEQDARGRQGGSRSASATGSASVVGYAL